MPIAGTAREPSVERTTSWRAYRFGRIRLAARRRRQTAASGRVPRSTPRRDLAQRVGRARRRPCHAALASFPAHIQRELVVLSLRERRFSQSEKLTLVAPPPPRSVRSQ